MEEVLKHPSVTHVRMVELDEDVPRVARTWLPGICGNACDDPRLEVTHEDGRVHLRDGDHGWDDVIIADLPDPDSEAVALLHTHEFHRLVVDSLTPGGVFVTQSASPHSAIEVTASLLKTTASVFTNTSIHVPFAWSHGPWSFVVGTEALGLESVDEATLAAREAEFEGEPLLMWTPTMHHAAHDLMRTGEIPQRTQGWPHLDRGSPSHPTEVVLMHPDPRPSPARRPPTQRQGMSRRQLLAAAVAAARGDGGECAGDRGRQGRELVGWALHEDHDELLGFEVEWREHVDLLELWARVWQQFELDLEW